MRLGQCFTDHRDILNDSDNSCINKGLYVHVTFLIDILISEISISQN